jgi:hypothetical protein
MARVTVTQYIVWDNMNNTVVGGPFINSSDATTDMRRRLAKSDGLNKIRPVYTVESITTVKQG